MLETLKCPIYEIMIWVNFLYIEPELDNDSCSNDKHDGVTDGVTRWAKDNILLVTNYTRTFFTFICNNI